MAEKVIINYESIISTRINAIYEPFYLMNLDQTIR